MGPRPPSPVHPRPPRRASPSKRAQISGPGESSHSRPEPLQPPATQDPTQSSPQLSPTSRIRRPLFSCDAIPGNVNYRAKDFHGESYYDIPVLETDPRFRDSMRLVHRYSLLPFMTPRYFFYPRVVLEFLSSGSVQSDAASFQLRWPSWGTTSFRYHRCFRHASSSG